jgi:hypothetical protein
LSGDAIPFRVRVGVTGHRRLPPDIDWRERIDRALAVILDSFPKDGVTTLRLTAVSSLAEGADRLVAAAVMDRPGSRLEVPLPLPPDEYEKDFKTARSREEFHSLLRSAASVMRPRPAESREEAYEWAGHIMVGHSDVVIALWDGLEARGQGGTGQIVEFARRHRRAVVWIPTSPDGEIRTLRPYHEAPRTRAPRAQRWYLRFLGAEIPWHAVPAPARRVAASLRRWLLRTVNRPSVPADDPSAGRELKTAFLDLELYNRTPLDPARLQAAEARARGEFMRDTTVHGDPQQAGEGGRIWAQIADWLVPHFARADIIAIDAQTTFRQFFWSIYLLPVLAISTVAIQIEFFPSASYLLGIEALLLIGALFLLWWERQKRWHRIWIESRHLAERCRCAFFLAAVDPPGPRRSDADDTASQPLEVLGEETSQESRVWGFHESAASWLQRAFGEIWQSRPAGEATEDDLELLRSVLAINWVGGQVVYHDKAKAFHGAAHRALNRSIQFLFASAVAIAGIHALRLAGAGAESALYVAAITLPALAAALLAIEHQREYRRTEERSAEMSIRLLRARNVLAEAKSMAQLRDEARMVEDMIMDENRDWFGLMRLRVLELPA